MNATIALELNHKPNRIGLHHINLRVTFKRKIKRKGTGVFVAKNHFNPNAKTRKWVKTSDFEAISKNDKLYRKRLDLEKQIDQFILENGEFNLINFFTAKSATQKSTCYFQFAYKEYKQLLASDKIGTAKKRRVSHQRFAQYYNRKQVAFNNSTPLPFNKITPDLLVNFRNWMNKRQLSYNTVVSTIKDLRTVYNQAIGQSIISSDMSPFNRGKFTVGEMRASKKECLTFEEIQSLLKFKPQCEKLQLALDCFLFSFFTNGTRASDVIFLQWSNVKENVLKYRMIKNNKLSPPLLLTKQAQDIMARYQKRDDDFIFPFFYGNKPHTISANFKNKKTESAQAVINKNLKAVALKCSIEKNLTMHVARHSFANFAKDNQTSVELIKELLNHKNIKTTYAYLRSFSDEKLNQTSQNLYSSFI